MVSDDSRRSGSDHDQQRASGDPPLPARSEPYARLCSKATIGLRALRLRFKIKDGFPVMVAEEAILPPGCDSTASSRVRRSRSRRPRDEQAARVSRASTGHEPKVTCCDTARACCQIRAMHAASHLRRHDRRRRLAQPRRRPDLRPRLRRHVRRMLRPRPGRPSARRSPAVPRHRAWPVSQHQRRRRLATRRFAAQRPANLVDPDPAAAARHDPRRHVSVADLPLARRRHEPGKSAGRPSRRTARASCTRASPRSRPTRTMPRVFWAGVEIDGLHRSTDGGATWQRYSGPGLVSQDIHDLAVPARRRPAGDAGRDQRRPAPQRATTAAPGKRSR